MKKLGLLFISKEGIVVGKRKVSMTTQIVIAVILGIACGLIFPNIGKNVKIVGDLFLRLMQMAIPVLILGQVIQAVGSINKRELTTLGGKTMLVFGLSSFIAALWGVLAGVLFKPGQGMSISTANGASAKVQEISLSETLLNFIPDNIFKALTDGAVIQIILFAMFFGIALNYYLYQHPNSQLLILIIDFNEVIIQVIRYVMFFAPIGIFALIASTISSLGMQVIYSLLKYLLVYGVATLLFMILWVLVLMVSCRINPIRLIRNMKDMLIMSLATTSSAITLPVAMEESQEKIGISSNVTNLVLPLGMSLNSNGSAMHMAITVITIAQMYHFNFSFTELITVAVVATFVSLANAVVPGAGIVSLAVIVPQMGLPIESIAVFAGVEWFVGMLRAVLNVSSDVFSAVLVASSVDELDHRIFNGESLN
ncbi:dicarboxylate/amino acid:cation symporter [Vagococcus silagei]|uniref:Dicarboxylate/amino acid:cation symporter n=1 Tax=Vagococcus silagei TaxID=2508885 RepID=A0A4V3TV19_9ENTE|nr:dicarboxylate/amino acid:cation symporter [Vagococcus silagei]THB61179.1 dicarboxylate/amino acid:cation symporter [Vagococcus silagei]